MKSVSLVSLVPNVRQLLVAAAVGLTLSVAVSPALAEPHGPRGMHGGGGAEQMLGRILEHARSRLNLNTSQQVIFDNAVAQSQSAHEAARANRQQVKAALKAELAKPDPDFAAVAAVADSVEQQNRALRLAVRNEWLRLYAALSPEQKSIARDMVQQRLERAESFGSMVREHRNWTRPQSN